MINRLINSEKEYLTLVADAIEFGVHRPNPYAQNRDEDGLSGADSFDTFPVAELYRLLGVYIEDEPLPDTLLSSEEDDDEELWEEWSNHFEEWKPEYRDKLKLFPDNPSVRVPKPKHYPIVVYWVWLDSWDRQGDIRERIFQWWSIKELEGIASDSLKKTRELWDSKFKAKIEEYAKRQKEQRKKQYEEQKAKNIASEATE